MRIGLISDTHLTKRGQLWPQVFDAFAGVDAILHAGDVWVPDVIDELAELAPVHVARGNGDVGVAHERLRDAWLVDFQGVAVGLLHEFPSPGRRPARFVLQQAGKRFGGRRPDVVVYGHTHIEELHSVGGLLFANPGSPTLPHNKSLRLGTIGFLTARDGRAHAELCQLTESGTAPIARAELAADSQPQATV